jgi:hypothetical protein
MDDPAVDLDAMKKSLEKSFELNFIIKDDVTIP